ncbi:MAG TPA: recombination mediator RecR [Deltaproteobacteria bacterium]|jgi:recombination protein RecR|nr:recombination mediator RecR [Deltaproteobacteria bacterium]HQH99642.1 recombination mediator RecR [Deltaproteobacteria bacterium]HQJ09989.1 recombination mediator RecR [Deltaproteobacteria bacterium]
MDPYPKPLRDLISQLKRLPGVGEKTATRLALFILGDRDNLAGDLSRSLETVSDSIRLCPICFNLTDMPKCSICQDPSRDPSIICVVEEPSDVLALESAHALKGLYHVLHGLISPINGIGPEDIKLPELIERLSKNSVSEVIVATNPSVEGEGTFHYITRLIEERKLPVRISRIASGIPMGGELKYMDQVTLASALRYRRSVKEK